MIDRACASMPLNEAESAVAAQTVLPVALRAVGRPGSGSANPGLPLRGSTPATEFGASSSVARPRPPGTPPPSDRTARADAARSIVPPPSTNAAGRHRLRTPTVRTAPDGSAGAAAARVPLGLAGAFRSAL
jgi:hypothetical protein